MSLNLNWRELEILVSSIRPQVQGLFVDRIIIPERPRYPGGYIKGEWLIRLHSRNSERSLLFSIRPRHPSLTLLEGKGPKAATSATHSPFEMALSKQIKGARILDLEVLPKERVVVLWLGSETGQDRSDDRLGLVLALIPANPEALLVLNQASTPPEKGWEILARSRTLRGDSPAPTRYHPPDGSKAPPSPPVRQELVSRPEVFYTELEKSVDGEAFNLRLKAAEKILRDLTKQARERQRQSEVALREAEAEPDWRHYGDLMKSSLPQSPQIIQDSKGKPVREVYDFATDTMATIPADPKLSPQAQVEKFYQLARRKNRRLEEARTRASNMAESAERSERLLGAPPTPCDWEGLESFERAAGIAPPSSAGAAAAQAKENKKRAGYSWLGKVFTSKDGLSIWVGRSKDENLELTFKHARGNDLWMHVRGKPGAHVVIPLSSGKSAPLETLLDAAHLTVFYSGGGKWGKTEVDYTFKKHVKRIKDSTEASYTHNKTLLIDLDPARMKRLLGQ